MTANKLGIGLLLAAGCAFGPSLGFAAESDDVVGRVESYEGPAESFQIVHHNDTVILHPSIWMEVLAGDTVAVAPSAKRIDIRILESGNLLSVTTGQKITLPNPKDVVSLHSGWLARVGKWVDREKQIDTGDAVAMDARDLDIDSPFSVPLLGSKPQKIISGLRLFSIRWPAENGPYTVQISSKDTGALLLNVKVEDSELSPVRVNFPAGLYEVAITNAHKDTFKSTLVAVTANSLPKGPAKEDTSFLAPDEATIAESVWLASTPGREWVFEAFLELLPYRETPLGRAVVGGLTAGRLPVLEADNKAPN